MNHRAIVLAFLVGGPALPVTAAETLPPAILPVDQTSIAARAIACIRTHAQEVALVSPNLHDAAEFLVTDLCADEVGLYQRYARNVQLLKQWQSMGSMDPEAAPAPRGRPPSAAKMAADLRAMTVDPETAELSPPPTTDPSSVAYILVTSAQAATYDLSTSHLRAVAAQAVLEARRGATH